MSEKETRMMDGVRDKNEMYSESESYEQRKTLAKVIGILEDKKEQLRTKTEKVIVFYLNNN